jgi:hypothetical protein
MRYTGDGKRIVIGDGLVEGPNGYEVAEVYSDDCPKDVAEANARLIAAAPELLKALAQVTALLDASNRGTDRPSDYVSRAVRAARAAIAAAEGRTNG